MTIPIGILTKNRAVYLNETLNSFDASLPITIFDDVSDDPDAIRYLDTNDEFQVQHEWPDYLESLDLQNNPTLIGIDGTYPVVQFCPESVGVVNASCWAIRDLFRANPDAPAVILLQDDIILSDDWYERLTNYPRDGVGIVAGMHIDYRKTTDYFTAQCYLITREFYENQNWWFLIMRPAKNNFDVKICRKAEREGFKVELLKPYCCQHIGVESIVRPDRPFKTDSHIRMGING